MLFCTGGRSNAQVWRLGQCQHIDSAAKPRTPHPAVRLQVSEADAALTRVACIAYRRTDLQENLHELTLIKLCKKMNNSKEAEVGARWMMLILHIGL